MDLQILNFLGKSLNINQLKQIHSLIIINHHSILPRFTEALLEFSHTSYARKVFDEMPNRDERMYKAFITAYTKQGSYREALGLFNSMRSEITHAPKTFHSVLNCCSELFMMGLGKQVHALSLKFGLKSNCPVQTSVMDMYAKCGDLISAKSIFDDFFNRDPMMYDCMIAGYSNCGDDVAAMKLFDEMPDKTDVSCNSMITCFARSGRRPDAVKMFELMQSEKFQPNERSLVTVLSACASLGDLDMGLKLKKYIDDDNNLRTDMIISTALLKMLVKCGAVNEARQVFDRMKEKDVVTWSSMIAGYAQNGRSVEALILFERMKRQQIKPNDAILVNVLSACAKLCSVKTGEELGNYIKVGGFDSNINVATTLLTMYSRCKNMKKAWQVFDGINENEKDVVCWNSMISGLAFNGFAGGAINLFLEMEKLSMAGEIVEGGTDDDSFKPDCLNKETNKARLKPDNVTFVSLLTACAHVGLVGMALQYFKSMRKDYNIVPQIEHYACIVELYCRIGELNEAYEFICGMKDPPNAVIWRTLLSFSSNSYLELAEIALKKLIEVEPENSSNYVRLSNIYSDAGRWQDAMQVRNRIRGNNLLKISI